MSRSRETGFKFNDSYHAFFDGFSERKDPQTGRIERVYMADYYEHDMSSLKAALLKTGFSVLFIFAVICLLLPLWVPNTITASPVAVILEFLTIIILVINAVFLIMYITARRKMTIGEYHQTAERPKRFVITGMIIYLLLFLAYLILLITGIVNGTMISGDIIVLAGALLGAAAVAAIWFIQRTVRYRTVKNDAVRREDSVEIWR